MRYAFDTNTIIDFLRDNLNALRKFKAAVEQGEYMCVPVFVHYEILR